MSKKSEQQDQTLVERIDAQIAVATRDQADAEQAYSEESLALVERPDDAKLHEELAQLKVERDTAASRVESLRAARAEAARRDSAAALEEPQDAAFCPRATEFIHRGGANKKAPATLRRRGLGFPAFNAR